MNIPLPKALNVSKPTDDHNAGLWYDKFFDRWNADFSAPTDTGKSDWVSASAKVVGKAALLEETCTRIGLLATEQQGVVAHFRTDGPFVTGLGREHPVENGFAWHHTLGVPYLPGSSLKGILRAYAREQGFPAADIARMFGSDNRRDIAVGSVIFFDAIPSAPVQLKADVMTPHYGPYYEDKNGRTPPSDWHDPNPIPFLVVAGQQPFVFACAPRLRNESGRSDCEKVSRWLPEALDWLGAGAKTAVGYGCFRLDDAANKENAEAIREENERRRREAMLAERLEGLSSIAQELERAIESQQLETDRDRFTTQPLIEQWLDKLEADPAPDAVQRFSGLVRRHFPELLENPDKTKGKKRKPVFNTRQRQIAERIHKMTGK